MNDREGSPGYDLYTRWRREVRSAGLLVRFARGPEETVKGPRGLHLHRWRVFEEWLQTDIEHVDVGLHIHLSIVLSNKKSATHTTSCDITIHTYSHPGFIANSSRDGKMSNQTVGAVYQQIIRDVVDSSRVDFEEGGVDESVLDELTRVSSLHLCCTCYSPHRDIFHRIIISSVSNIPDQRCEKPRSASQSAVVIVVGLRCRGCCSVLRALAAARARRGIQNQRGPSGIWSLLCLQGDAVSLGLARFWEAPASHDLGHHSTAISRNLILLRLN